MHVERAPIPLHDLVDGDRIDLPPRGGMRASVHIIDQHAIDALRAALVTGRPLLVRGDPGTGKSQLARAAAEWLGRAFVTHTVDSRTETRDLLWTIDAVARLSRAQMIGALKHGNESSLHVRNFLHPGPLWWAFDWDSAEKQARLACPEAPDVPEPPGAGTKDEGVVVLVDEIDKSDPSVPNGLLDALGHGRFEVPGRAHVEMKRTPLVVITTNEERALPDAFLRRCWVLHLSLPPGRNELVKTLVACGRAHFKTCNRSVLRETAELLADDREKIRALGLMPPGLAEYLDVLHAVTKLATTAREQRKLLKRVAAFAFEKHPPEPR